MGVLRRSPFRQPHPLVTRAVMHRALQGEPLSHSFLPCPECTLDEAWEEAGKCVARQLAVLLDAPLGDIEADYSALMPGWDEFGATSELLLAFCEIRS